MNIKHILLIDDSEDGQFLGYQCLHRFWPTARIEQRYNGRDALDYLKSNEINSETQPQLIFLDIHMPIMDGHAFLTAFSKEFAHSDMGIFVLTSSDHDNDRRMIREYDHVKGYLIKPLIRDNLEWIARMFEEPVANGA